MYADVVHRGGSVGSLCPSTADLQIVTSVTASAQMTPSSLPTAVKAAMAVSSC